MSPLASPYADRVARLRSRMATLSVEGLLLSNIQNIGWLTGFTGSHAYAFVDARSAWIAVDSRYTLQAAQECASVELRSLTSSGAENLASLLSETGCPSVGYESMSVTVDTLARWTAKLPPSISLAPVDGIIETLRQVKDAAEIGAIEAACRVADATFEYIISFLRPGLSERDAMLEIEWRMRKHGGAEVAFPSIVVSGERTAMPHGQPTDRILSAGDLVTMDFGARLNGYCSDITRTIALGRANDTQKAVYRTVLDAQCRAMEGMTAQASSRAVDALARKHIRDAGYGEYFGHGLGHHLGRDVHDGPSMSPHLDFALEPGMVLTVEPGIYIPEWGGVRIEHDVLITESAPRVLTASTTELLEL